MAKQKKGPGPQPERLVIDANWRDAAKLAMAKGKPPENEVTPVTKPRKTKRRPKK